MISKVINLSRQAITAGCKYIIRESKLGVILASQGIRAYDAKLMANDFKAYLDQDPTINKVAIFHGILSFAKNEKIPDQLASEIGVKYLESLGFQNSSYVIVTHTDKEHYHAHCMASYIDFKGEKVDDSFIGLRAKKISQKLTQEYGLIPALKRDLSRTDKSRFRQNDVVKYQLIELLTNSKNTARSFEQFQNILKSQNIEIKFKYKSGTTEIQGWSFKKGDFCYKASELDRNFSFNKIKKSFEHNHSRSFNYLEEKKLSHSDNQMQERSPKLFSGFSTPHIPVDREEYTKNKKKKKKLKKTNGNSIQM